MFRATTITAFIQRVPSPLLHGELLQRQHRLTTDFAKAAAASFSTDARRRNRRYALPDFDVFSEIDDALTIPSANNRLREDLLDKYFASRQQETRTVVSTETRHIRGIDSSSEPALPRHVSLAELEDEALVAGGNRRTRRAF